MNTRVRCAVSFGVKKAIFFLLAIVSQTAFAGTYCEVSDIPATEIVDRIASQNDSGASSTCRNQQKTTFFTKVLSSSSTLTVCDKEMQAQFGGSVPPGWVITAHYANDSSSSSNCDWQGSTYTTKYSANRIEKVSSFVSASYKNICAQGRNVGYRESDLAAVSWFVTDSIPSGSNCSAPYVNRQIRKAASGLSMCATYAYVPDGFSISRITQNDSGCSTALFGTGTKYTIGSSIPQTGSVSTCLLPSNLDQYAYQLRTNSTSSCAGGPQYDIGGAFEGAYSCAVPSGWGASAIVPETNTQIDCSSNFVYRLAALKDGLVTCYIESQQAPAGYVVSSYSSQVTACNNKAGYTLRTPKDGIYMCSLYSPIPVGFWYGAAGAKNGCSSGYDLAVLPSSGRVSTCGEPPSAPPDGYVYTAITDFSSCPTGKKQYTVGIAASTQPICYVQSQSGPIPQGYMISSDRSGASCAAGVSLTIKVVTDGMQACSAENMPVGYAISSVTNGTNTNCSDYHITVKQIVGEGPFTVCSTNHVPAGYVITAVDNNAMVCSGKGFTIRKPVISGSGAIYGHQVCVDQPIAVADLPEGMVIRRIVTNNTSCSGQSGLAYEIGFPNSSGQTVACQNFGNPQYELPSGFNIITTSTFSECNNGSGWLLGAVVSGAIPGAFVLPEPDVSASDVTAPNYDCGGNGTVTVVGSASKNTIVCP